MLHPSEETIAEIEGIGAQVFKGEGDREKLLQRILELDPVNQLALEQLADDALKTGDREKALELRWRQLRARPDSGLNYLRVAEMYEKNDPFAIGLAALAYNKLTHNPEEADIAAEIWRQGNPELANVPALPVVLALARSLEAETQSEPPEVAERLKILRWLDEVQSYSVMLDPMVDRIVGNGAEMAPLLVGLLRGWALGWIADKEALQVGNAAALLGEIGEAKYLSDLLETSTDGMAVVGGPATWAVDRIIAQHPEEATAELSELGPRSPASIRSAAARALLINRHIDPSGAVYNRLYENFEMVEKDSRDVCLSGLVMFNAMLRGRPGLENGRAWFRKLAPLLSKEGRREVEDVLTSVMDLPAHGVRDEAEPPAHSIYEICGGKVDWKAEFRDVDEDGEDDSEYVPEPIQRHATPGRNDPCWCGSGKKYKKCHLDSDEASARECQ